MMQENEAIVHARIFAIHHHLHDRRLIRNRLARKMVRNRSGKSHYESEMNSGRIPFAAQCKIAMLRGIPKRDLPA